jgi:predicted PurR-regulated permease PerM
MWERYRSIVFICFGIGLFLYICFILRQALLLIYISALFAVLLYPLARDIQKIRIRKWSPGVGSSVLILFSCILGTVVLILIWFVPKLLGDVHGIRQVWPQRLHQIQEWMHRTVPVLNINANEINGYLREFLRRNFQPGELAKSLISVGTVGLTSAYFMIDGKRSISWLISLFPLSNQPRIRSTLFRGGSHMQRWLSGQAILMATHGTSAFLVFWLLHIKYFYALAVFAGLVNVIPVLGPIITVIVAGLIAAMDSFSKVLGVIVFFVIYHNVENAFLNPKIMASRVAIPGVTIIVALVLGEEFAGIVGMLIAVPTAVLISVLVKEYVTSDRGSERNIVRIVK